MKENKEDIKKELAGLNSSLRQPESSSGFRVPDYYFESLPEKIQERLHVTEKARPFLFGVFPYSRFVPAMAAVLLLIGLTFGIYFTRPDESAVTSAYAEAMVDVEYFTSQAFIDQQLLYDIVSESGLTVDEILFVFENESQAWEIEDEYLEYILEDSRYYGIENSYLLSSLDIY